jgi:rare lipoprotein A
MTPTLLAVALLLPPPATLTASYYGPGFHGRLTASGQPFDMHAMTCASPDLPFGAVLLLERQGRSVACTVTDRGPYAVDSVGRALHPLSPHPRRQLDLSAGAMKRLGGISAGVVELRAWRLL